MSTYPAFAVEWAPGIDPSTAPDPGDWVDVSTEVVADWSVKWGRWSEFSESGAGTGDLTLDNSSGDWDPDNTGGPNFGNLVAGTWFRILGGTTSANTDVFYGHVDDKGFQIEASQFPDSFVRISLVDDLEQLSHSDMPESVHAMEVTADAPLVWLRLSESSGTAATDSSGNGRHGTYEGGATFNSRAGLIVGSSDNAIGFDGVDDRVVVADSTTVPAKDDPATYEAWFSVAAGAVLADAVPILLARPTQAEVVVGLRSTGEVYGFHDNNGSGRSVESSGSVVDGGVHHAVLTYDGSEVEFFLDGVSIGTDSAGFPAQNDYGLTVVPLMVGGDTYVMGDRFFPGVIDEVAVYDTVLSAARILAHYEAGAAPWEGDTTGERVTHLLDAVDYDATLRNIDTGQSTMQSFTSGGSAAVDGAREAAKAEAGYLYVDHQDGGNARFVGRHERWTATASVTSQATFGDSGSEITYDAISLEDDRVINVATVQRANGITEAAEDTTSSGARRRTFSESGLQYESDAESQYRAERIVAEKKDRHRVPRTITLRPRKSTHAAWAHVFARLLNDRVTVKWRPPYGGTYTFTCWIDGISHKWSSRSGLETTLYLSPVPYDTTGAPYALWGTSTWETGTSVFRWSY